MGGNKGNNEGYTAHKSRVAQMRQAPERPWIPTAHPAAGPHILLPSYWCLWGLTHPLVLPA